MKHTKEEQDGVSMLLTRNTMLKMIVINIAVSALVLCNHIFEKFLPENIITEVLYSIWELLSIFIVIFVAVSIIVLILKIFRRKRDLLYPYMASVILTIIMIFVFPYLV